MRDIHLIGAETVQGAARTMSGAASEMATAAYNMECVFDRQRNFLDDWLQRFQTALDEHAAKIAHPAVVIEPAPIQEESPAPQRPEKIDYQRHLMTPSPQFPCMVCGGATDPGESGCGKPGCPHDNIPF